MFNPLDVNLHAVSDMLDAMADNMSNNSTLVSAADFRKLSEAFQSLQQLRRERKRIIRLFNPQALEETPVNELEFQLGRYIEDSNKVNRACVIYERIVSRQTAHVGTVEKINGVKTVNISQDVPVGTEVYAYRTDRLTDAEIKALAASTVGDDEETRMLAFARAIETKLNSVGE